MPKGVYQRTEYHRQGLRVPHKGSGIYKHKKGYKRPPLSQGWKDNISKAKKGKLPKNFEMMNKPFKKGHLVPKEWRDKLRKNKIGKRASKETIKKMSEGQKGEKGSNWKGGITPFRKLIRSCYKYRQWRSDIFTRDDFTCVLCGKRGGWIEADHIKSFSKILEENNIKSLEEALD